MESNTKAPTQEKPATGFYPIPVPIFKTYFCNTHFKFILLLMPTSLNDSWFMKLSVYKSEAYLSAPICYMTQASHP